MGQDKSEIPKQDYFSSISNANQSDRGADSISDNPVTSWLQSDAKSKLQEAFQKLGLDNTKVNGKHLLSYSLEELMQEKKKVKNELKYYDQAFLNKFSRIPNRTEKEPMRHIYMYYKRLKQSIQK